MNTLLTGIISLAALPMIAAPGGQAEAVVPPLLDECAAPAGFAPPVEHVYHLRNGATLVFIAVVHGGTNESPTQQLIRTTFDQYKPSLMMVEAVSSNRSGDPTYQQFIAARAARLFAADRADEIAYSIKIANDASVMVSGWDFTTQEDYQLSASHNFEVADIVGAHLLRRGIDPSAANVADEVATELKYANAAKPIASFDYAGWYRRNYGDTFRPSEGTPCRDGIASRIVKFETAKRNAHLIDLLLANVTPGKVVMIEAGANHWLALRGYLASISTS